MVEQNLSIERIILEGVQMICTLTGLAAFSNIWGMPKIGDYQTINEQDTSQ